MDKINKLLKELINVSLINEADIRTLRRVVILAIFNSDIPNQMEKDFKRRKIKQIRFMCQIRSVKGVFNNYVESLSFYETEIQERKLFFYPPYYKMIHLTLRNTDERKLNAAAQNLTDKLRLVFKERVVGPEFPLIKRIQNFFIKEIKIKIEKDASDRKVKEKIQEMIDLFYAEADNKSSRLSIDVDPY